MCVRHPLPLCPTILYEQESPYFYTRQNSQSSFSTNGVDDHQEAASDDHQETASDDHHVAAANNDQSAAESDKQSTGQFAHVAVVVGIAAPTFVVGTTGVMLVAGGIWYVMRRRRNGGVLDLRRRRSPDRQPLVEKQV